MSRDLFLAFVFLLWRKVRVHQQAKSTKINLKHDYRVMQCYLLANERTIGVSEKAEEVSHAFNYLAMPFNVKHKEQREELTITGDQ